MTSASDTVHYQGKPMDRLSYERLKSQNMMLRSPVFGGEKSDATLLQGIGYAAASGNTHAAPGGCYDLTPFNHPNRQLTGRLLGGADWYRPPGWDNAGGGPHVHCNTIGAGYESAAGRAQWTAYYAGRNGLRNNAKDPGPRLHTKPLFVAPWTTRGARGVYYLTKSYTARAEAHSTTKSLGVVPKGAKFTVVGVVNNGGNLWGINRDGKHIFMGVLSKTKVSASKPATPKPDAPTLRIGTLNFPDKTKITTASESQRIKRALAQIEESNLDIIGLQEGVGRLGPGKPSALMTVLGRALGSDWDVVTPTLDLNENYFLRRKSSTNYRQHPDVVLRGTLAGKAISGRHISLTTFETAIGSVTLGNTQLVNDNRPAAEVQAGLAFEALKDAADGGKAVLLGDLNTSGPLTALTKAGMKNARLEAKAAANRNAVTYTNQTKTKPSTDPDWLIDWIWTSPSITVNGYTVVQDLDSKGNFVQPRVSDHSLVIVSLS